VCESQVGHSAGWSALAQRVWIECLEVCVWMAAGGAPGCPATEATALREGLTTHARGVAERLFWLFAPCTTPALPSLLRLPGLVSSRVRALVEPPPRYDHTRLNQAVIMLMRQLVRQRASVFVALWLLGLDAHTRRVARDSFLPGRAESKRLQF
jgi:hypothetical protein